MNAIPLRIEPALPLEPFTAALTRANAWRGACIETFARSEAAITDCLVILSAVEKRGVRVMLPHLVGQRLEALAVAIGAGGPFEAEGGGIAPALDICRTHANLRNMLCHGQATLSLDQQGRWTLVMRLVTLRSKRVERETVVFTEAEAEAVSDKIASASQELRSQLGQLKKRFG